MTLLEFEMSMPSVLGLVSGAMILRLEKTTPLQWFIEMWFLWLLR